MNNNTYLIFIANRGDCCECYYCCGFYKCFFFLFFFFVKLRYQLDIKIMCWDRAFFLQQKFNYKSQSIYFGCKRLSFYFELLNSQCQHQLFRSKIVGKHFAVGILIRIGNEKKNNYYLGEYCILAASTFFDRSSIYSLSEF